MKKLTSFLGHLGTLILSVLGIVFLTQPHFTSSSLNGALVESVGAFKLNMEGAPDAIFAGYVFAIIATIALSFLIIMSIMNILADFNVIKNNKILKVLTAIFAILTVVFLVAIFICMAVQVVDYNNDAIISKFTTSYIGWGSIVNFALCFVIPVFCLLGGMGGKAKKSSKKK